MLQAHKIMIVGRPGSGKSTAAIALQKKLNIPLFHLDKYFFEHNWIERNYQEFIHIQKEIISKPQWIIDGNSTKSYELRYPHANLCLYFNFPRWLCYYRVFKRLFFKHPAIDDRASGCQETVRWPLLKYMWGFETRVAPILKQLRDKFPTTQFIELQNDREVREFFKNFN